ncbi:hypothetical protein VSH64_13515 [Amycolatopsis rhabdoformis]|uniref:Uncharacterized protein n=1 Tax=Amycolatopsis rhabdoformis TaxID=1448059 RepID=A0ABZ1IHJ5_9PSEU|nr:hypothetical protein [Amycolatopsis rhabdoformis]WSE33123.1 hypothetical protein VSH64_13515 [Amycolatopsis rhabdoformis]
MTLGRRAFLRGAAAGLGLLLFHGLRRAALLARAGWDSGVAIAESRRVS